MNALLGFAIFVCLPLAFFYWIWRLSKNSTMQAPFSSFSGLFAEARKRKMTAILVIIAIAAFLITITVVRLSSIAGT